MIRAIVASMLLGIYVIGVGGPSLENGGSPNGVPSASQARNWARSPRPTRGPSQEELRLALERALEPAEQVDCVARAVGCTLILTDQRLLLVRDGAEYRPTTGIRAWALAHDLVLRLGRAHRQTNRLAISRGAETAGVFLSADQLPDAQRLISEARRRTFAEDGRAT